MVLSAALICSTLPLPPPSRMLSPVVLPLRVMGVLMTKLPR